MKLYDNEEDQVGIGYNQCIHVNEFYQMTFSYTGNTWGIKRELGTWLG